MSPTITAPITIELWRNGERLVACEAAEVRDLTKQGEDWSASPRSSWAWSRTITIRTAWVPPEVTEQLVPGEPLVVKVSHMGRQLIVEPAVLSQCSLQRKTHAWTVKEDRGFDELVEVVVTRNGYTLDLVLEVQP